eukprot:Gb_30766 [translate_table: standard]
MEVDGWLPPSDKNAYKTGHILTWATSTWGMMKGETRTLSKIPDEVRGEIHPYILERVQANVAEDTKKLFKLDDETAQYIRSDLRHRLIEVALLQVYAFLSKLQ